MNSRSPSQSRLACTLTASKAVAEFNKAKQLRRCESVGHILRTTCNKQPHMFEAISKVDKIRAKYCMDRPENTKISRAAGINEQSQVDRLKRVIQEQQKQIFRLKRMLAMTSKQQFSTQTAENQQGLAKINSAQTRQSQECSETSQIPQRFLNKQRKPPAFVAKQPKANLEKYSFIPKLSFSHN